MSNEATFDFERACDLIDQMEDDADMLKDALRGADSALVSRKLKTLQSTLRLLRVYVEDAAQV